MIAYPGIGAFKGVLGWSQQGQYEQEMRDAAEKYGPIYETYAGMDFAELAANPEAQKLGASLYASYCTTCHGSDARGAPGFPNLADDDWLWGNSEAQLTASIARGRTGIMTPWGAVLGSDEAVTNMARYVRSLSGLEQAGDAVQGMQMQFQTLCGACHMPTGTGNQLLGAPNLTDGIWLYGSSIDTIRTTIANGRMGEMPPHGELLGEDRTRILAAYIYSLSQQ